MKRFYIRFREYINYCIFGLGTTVVSWGLYSLLAGALRWPEAISNAISWVGAVLFAFVTNKLWVFENGGTGLRAWLKEGAAFFSGRIATGVLELGGVPLLIRLGMAGGPLNIPGLWAKILASCFVMIVNYFISKFLVFRRRGGQKSTGEEENSP